MLETLKKIGLDWKSFVIGVLATLLAFTVLTNPPLTAQDSDQTKNLGDVIVSSITVTNSEGQAVFVAYADSVGNGGMMVRNRTGMPLALVRNVRENNRDTGLIYCNGVGLWGPNGKVNTLMNSDGMQFIRGQ